MEITVYHNPDRWSNIIALANKLTGQGMTVTYISRHATTIIGEIKNQKQLEQLKKIKGVKEVHVDKRRD